MPLTDFRRVMRLRVPYCEVEMQQNVTTPPISSGSKRPAAADEKMRHPAAVESGPL